MTSEVEGWADDYFQKFKEFVEQGKYDDYLDGMLQVLMLRRQVVKGAAVKRIKRNVQRSKANSSPADQQGTKIPPCPLPECIMPQGHSGAHEDYSGDLWEQDITELLKGDPWAEAPVNIDAPNAMVAPVTSAKSPARTAAGAKLLAANMQALEDANHQPVSTQRIKRYFDIPEGEVPDEWFLHNGVASRKDDIVGRVILVKMSGGRQPRALVRGAGNKGLSVLFLDDPQGSLTQKYRDKVPVFLRHSLFDHILGESV